MNDLASTGMLHVWPPYIGYGTDVRVRHISLVPLMRRLDSLLLQP